MNKTKLIVVLSLLLAAVGMLFINSERKVIRLKQDVALLQEHVDALERYTRANLYKTAAQIMLTNTASICNSRALHKELVDSLKSDCEHYQKELKK